ncbi:MAG: class I SAM-dependent methyltransferase [Candidatus Bathyarchaeota archaeon]|nr:class I SAM-dependent methyltransferase [Candidatus Bathyarchaeota archaeon A05DMB-3]MDH7607634.1 class I SAM-dependent methyltransferase [Candidatus Bathyarchaeota archaeon]
MNKSLEKRESLYMEEWIKKLFVERADIFLKLLNERWARTEELVNGMLKVLGSFGVSSGNLLDLCCGNGRISVYMAKKGFKTVGVDISRAFIEDANKKAKEHKVSDKTRFVEGDVRRLKEILKEVSEPFDVIVNAWTSIGYFPQEEELNIFKQARELSKEGAILFIAETAHTEFFSIKFTPTSYSEIDNFVILENRSYDPKTAQLNTTWSFYKKHGNNLKFIDKVDFQLHIYSLNELVGLLEKAGWETIAYYGSLMNLQPMNPLTSLNVIAKAI